MRALFKPATWLMNRLTYPQKFGVISLVFLAPLILIVFSLSRILNERIGFAARELDGTRYLRPLRPLIQHTLEEQFLAERYLDGDSGVERALQLKQAEIAADLDRLRLAEENLGPALDTHVPYTTMLNQWERLKAQLLLRSQSDNAAAHGRFIDAARILMRRAGDKSHLVVDPDLDAYYLSDATIVTLPEGQKLLSQLAGERALIASPAAGEEKVRFTVAFGLLQANSSAVGSGVRVAIEEDASNTLRPALEGPLRAFNTRLNEFEALLNAVMVDNAPLPPQAFRQQIDDSIATNFALWDASSSQLDTLLQRRIASLQRERNQALGLSILMTALAVYLLAGFYQALMETVAGFRRAAERMTGGDFGAGEVVAGRDELAQVAGSFNAIAAALIASSAQREAIVEHAALGVLTFGGAGQVLSSNPAAARLFGRSDLAGSPMADLFDLPPAQLQTVGASREAQGRRADGRTFPAELAVGSMPHAGAPLWIVFIRDVTLRRQAELERNQLQEDVIRAQATVLSKLSAPLIPISAEVMVMPLIGAVDGERMAAIVQSLLAGIETQRARMLIIDVTGVPLVDAAVAHGLLQASQGGRLLGARMVLTGIRPEVAQTFVELSLPLDGFETYGTLEQGIAAALSASSEGRSTLRAAARGR